jgi:hypothetical protein
MPIDVLMALLPWVVEKNMQLLCQAQQNPAGKNALGMAKGGWSDFAR